MWGKNCLSRSAGKALLLKPICRTGVHPNDRGHAIYYETIKRISAEGNLRSGLPSALPPPMGDLRYGNVRMLDAVKTAETDFCRGHILFAAGIPDISAAICQDRPAGRILTVRESMSTG